VKKHQVEEMVSSLDYLIKELDKLKKDEKDTEEKVKEETEKNSKDIADYDCAAAYNLDSDEKRGLTILVFNNEFFEGVSYTIQATAINFNW
jgi:hypothetical protein